VRFDPSPFLCSRPSPVGAHPPPPPPPHPPLPTCRLFEALAIDCGKLKVLAEAITAGYRQLPYHNAVHACDVAHGTFWLLKQQAPRPPPDDGNKPGDKTKGGAPPPPPFREGATCDELMPPYALLAAVLAAPLHDINHDGHNNTYHQQSGSEWAMTYASAPLPFQVAMPLPAGDDAPPLTYRYNDKSILENMHCAHGMRLLRSSAEQHGQGGRLGEATAGRHGLLRLQLKA